MQHHPNIFMLSSKRLPGKSRTKILDGGQHCTTPCLDREPRKNGAISLFQ
jgi:hypothetical protein